MSDVELQKLVGFDQDDLAANRRGKLSPRQEKRLRHTQQLRSVVFTGTGILAILSAIRLFLTFATSSNGLENRAASIGLPAVALGLIAWGSFKIAAQKVDQSVRCVRGRVCFIKSEKAIPEKKPNGTWVYRRVDDYQLRVGNVVFENVNRRIFSALNEQDIYTFYYAKHSGNILSVE